MFVGVGVLLLGDMLLYEPADRARFLHNFLHIDAFGSAIIEGWFAQYPIHHCWKVPIYYARRARGFFTRNNLRLITTLGPNTTTVGLHRLAVRMFKEATACAHTRRAFVRKANPRPISATKPVKVVFPGKAMKRKTPA